MGAGTTPGQVIVADVTMGADTSQFDVQNIPAGRNLRVLVFTRSDRPSSTQDDLGFRLNADAASNYITESLRADAATVTGFQTLTATAFIMSNCLTGATGDSGLYQAGELVIPNYSLATLSQPVLGRAGGARAANAATLAHLVGNWLGTAAITRVQALPFAGGANLKSGSRMVIFSE